MANAVHTSSSVMLTSGASGRVNALFSLRVWRSLIMLINAFVLLLLVPFRGRRRDEKREESGGSQHHLGKGAGGSSGGPVVRVPAKIVSWRKSGVLEQEVAARRALAIRRVVQDGGDDKKSVREYSLFSTARGNTIFTQSWTPVSATIR